VTESGAPSRSRSSFGPDAKRNDEGHCASVGRRFRGNSKFTKTRPTRPAAHPPTPTPTPFTEKPKKKRRLYRPVARMRPEDWREANHPKWASIEEVAVYKGCGVAAVNAYLDRGDFSAVKDHDAVKVDLDSVFAYDAGLPPRGPRRPRQPRLPPGALPRKRGRPRKAPSPNEIAPDSGEADSGEAAP
jgi:hypothetical protein